MSNISKIKVSGQTYDIIDTTARQQLLSCVKQEELPKNVSDLNNDSGFVTNQTTNQLNQRLTTVEAQLSGLSTELQGI